MQRPLTEDAWEVRRRRQEAGKAGSGREMGDEEEMMKMLDSAVTVRSLGSYFRCDAVMNWVPQNRA